MEEERCAVTPMTYEDHSNHQNGALLGISKLRGMEDALEHLNVLHLQESEAYPPCKDYLSPLREHAGADASDAVSEGWRRKLCEWCYEVVDHFGFDREAVAIALNYLDRSVAARSESSTHIAKRDFQLLAVTSLYMALKIHGETDSSDGPRRKLRIDAFVELSRGFFRVEVIEAMERNILNSLDWRVNPPTCLKFVAAYLRLCPKWTADDFSLAHANVIGGIYDVARYLTELSVCVSAFSFTCKTSVIAYAAILCAIEALQSSLPLPYTVRVNFQNNIAEATGLLPNDPDILRIREMLKDLCPNMFEGDEIPPEFLLDRATSSSNLAQDHTEDGKSSPVCIIDDQNASPRSRRKRSRPTADDSSTNHSNF